MKKAPCFTAWIGLILSIGTAYAAGLQILTNHIGYETTASKRAVIMGNVGDRVMSFSVVLVETGKTVYSGTLKKTGPVDHWRNWIFWTADFDSVRIPGKYCLECTANGQTIRSFPFVIQENLLERNTVSNVIYYFKGQRCSGLLDQADRHCPFSGAESKTADVHGGWFDATGDYGKHLSHLNASTYFNPQQIPLAVWSLFKSLEAFNRKSDLNWTQYKKRLLDEALYGADYLVRIKNPLGSFYQNISGRGPQKAPEDRRIAKIRESVSGLRDLKSKTVPDTTHSYDVGFRSGGGMAVAALAMAGAAPVSGDFGSSEYLKAAEDAFRFLSENNPGLTNDGKENIVDDYCALAAATELFKTTKKNEYKTAADQRAKHLMDRLIGDGKVGHYFRADEKDRPFFHAVDAGLPVVSLLYYMEIADAKTRERVFDIVKKAMASELEVTGEVVNPFGYARQFVQNQKGERRTAFFFPHDTETAPWWQGENARLGSLAVAARMAAARFQQDKLFCDKLRTYAWNQLNWILGLNPFDACMLHGSGRNNPPYLFFESMEYTNAPGGICNGITSGWIDEHGIDLNVPYSITGNDNDWRWGEQWLPHASWFLLAASLGE